MIRAVAFAALIAGCGGSVGTIETPSPDAGPAPEVSCSALPDGATRFPLDEGCFYTMRGESDRPIACVCEVIPPAPFDAGPEFFDAVQEKTDDAACCYTGYWCPGRPVCAMDGGAE